MAQSNPGSLIAGLLALGLVLAAGAATGTNVDLESLCSNKQVSLTKISLVRTLISENRRRQVGACARNRDSLEQLDEILEIVQTGAICDLKLVDKIRHYHQTFIDESSSENAAQREGIPGPLRHFFISLCFQISAECKMALINNLEYDTKDKITEEDYAQIQFLENYGATLLDSDGELSDFDDVLLLSDLSVASQVEEETGESKMLIKVKTNQMLRKLVANCNNKFKPYYDKLIMPLIRLSNLGYNYQGELLERELEELRHNKLVKRWYNIVQTCEVFRSIEVFEDPDMEVTSDDHRQMLTFITKDEAKLLRERHVKSLNEDSAERAPTLAVAHNDNDTHNEKAAPLTYEPVASHNDDELWIKDQRELNKLVSKYKASASEADRVRRKILKKMLARIKETLMSGKIFLLANELRRGGESVSTSSFNEDMLAMMDEAVEEDEISKGLAPGEPADGPVSQANNGGIFSGFGGTSRGIVSKLGPGARVKNMAVPARAKYIRKHTDGTKISKKWYNFSISFLPSKMNIFMWIVGIIGFLLIILSVCVTGG